MYHYFTGLDFQWCGSTQAESSRIVKCLRPANRLSLGLLDMKSFRPFVAARFNKIICKIIKPDWVVILPNG